MKLTEITPTAQEVNEPYCIMLKPFVHRVFVWVGEYNLLSEVIKYIDVSPGRTFVDRDGKDSAGQFVPLSPTTGLIWFVPNAQMRLSVIAHECFHAISWCLRHSAVELNEQTEEVWAHLLGDLFDQVTNRVLSETSK